MKPPKTCFISAPLGSRLDTLREALENRGLKVLVPQDLSIGKDWASETKDQLSQADLVIGVLATDSSSPWVLFELGQASALGRRIILITSPKAEEFPWPQHQLLVLRIDLENSEAIGFALDQVLSAPEPTKRERTKPNRPMTGLGEDAKKFLTRLEASLTEQDGTALQQTIADAIRASGTDVVASSPEHDSGVDIAVWSDVLEPFVGNPLLVEIKLIIRKSDTAREIERLATCAWASGSRWALLIYGQGPSIEEDPAAKHYPNVLTLSARSLLESISHQSFPELIRDLRNRRVHGASS